MKPSEINILKSHKIIREPNRYAQIHILFRLLAKVKLGPKAKSSDVTAKAKEVKKYWKNFFGVDSLTDLNDEELSRLSKTIKNRIETIRKLKGEELRKKPQ